MGWSQPQYAPIDPGLESSGTVGSSENAALRGTFADASKLRTVFVMDDELLRHGLIHVVSQSGRVALVGELRHDAGLDERLHALQPDLLVVGVDRNLPLAGLLAELDPAPKVIVVLDDACEPAQAIELIRAGADALVHRRSPSTDLLRAVQRVIEGQTALDAYSADALIAGLRAPGIEAEADCSRLLTRREREVLVLLTEGHDNRTIATRLFIAEATVKFHLHNIMDKFGVHKRAALVSAALRGNHAVPGGFLTTAHRG
jgi:DNA-binding NarL/FixJ family response regulator